MKTIAKKQRKDVYQMVSDLIIEKLENGIVPWRQVWQGGEIPANYVTKKCYRGINMWILLSGQFSQPYFLTFKQAQSLGGSIRKGSKGLPVCYWGFSYFDKKSGRKLMEEEAKRMHPSKIRKVGFLKYYTVFNIEDVDGVDFEIPETVVLENTEPIERCEQIIREMVNPPRIVHGIPEAYYSPVSDLINMPEKRLFESQEYYFSVLFHELTHATGHQDRLNRKEIVEYNEFGSEGYSREELTAEMGASYLCNHTGIMEEKLLDNSAAYIKVWLDRLRSDKRLLLEAASKAQKAVEYILTTCPF
ncbi:zincin-like metallopeptidase domain-containing protein [Belliella sp. R4-6]|uniref:Zincin-like metallopeptidase domain-containing protein n=1 Tax=Belliella alkalica TaxID=1730871 RepID=A0ABS9VFQ0_9BACT|nr:zincin-like metallopeptidase domain-containing protein [Belliella alkalica]MCH7415251.1 zincin-like metallopeptidase domain-containing protein [Belliella alkalica]